MEFIEILNKVRIIRTPPNTKEDKNMKEILNSIVDNYNVELIEMFSFEIFPKLYVHRNKNYLAWDMSFWNIFKNFIISYVFFDKACSEDDNDLACDAFNIMSMMICCYLSFRYYRSNKVLACNIALNYSEGLKRYEDGFSFASDANDDLFIENIVKIAKIYCCYHEIAHFLCRKNKMKNFKYINDRIETYFKILEISPHDTFEYCYGINKTQMLNYYQQRKNDTNLLEEMHCDIYAIEKTFDFVKKNHREHSVQVNLANCLETYERFTYFFTLLMTIEKTINTYCDEIDELISSNDVDKHIQHFRSEYIMRMAFNETIIRNLFYEWHPYEYANVDKYIYTNKGKYSEYTMSLNFEKLYSGEHLKQSIMKGNQHIMNINASLEEIFTSVFNW